MPSELPPGYHISYPGPKSPFYGKVMLHEPSGGFSLHPDGETARLNARLDRDAQLDEERIADQMEAAKLRGIIAPDY